MHLYLIRHPSPRDAGGTCYGRKDVLVDAESAAAAAAAIRARIPARDFADARSISSPLSRCLTLARELARPKAPEIDDDLLEMDFGAWEGKPWSDIPRGELDAWAADVWGYRPGGGESTDRLAHRWRRCSARMQDGNAAPVIAVTHAGLIRVALACEGLLGVDEFAAHSIGFGSVHLIALDKHEVRACALP